MSVTRIELLDHIESAFAGDPVTRDGLLRVARNSGARDEVIAVLHRLPEQRFSSPRDLWTELSDVPISV